MVIHMGDVNLTRSAVPLLLAVCILGCQSTYYTVWESLGKEKRHLLRDQIENVQRRFRSNPGEHA
ncbi:hypothetical protein D3OALGA1CA_1719 [Olavius algarvensis associated proteobacterium Delta 3]|nr:hypothetical protein D3OALGA1CA_1719 [Olavius algarvensis associated proteobacterium Delta 3]CAB5125972.1 hypothetical protein D3OALGB2SA_3289 [Olavius algarvensis associated proteobacterium Delta 3]